MRTEFKTKLSFIGNILIKKFIFDITSSRTFKIAGAERLKFANPDYQQMLKREKRKREKSERANYLLVHFFCCYNFIYRKTVVIL